MLWDALGLDAVRLDALGLDALRWGWMLGDWMLWVGCTPRPGLYIHADFRICLGQNYAHFFFRPPVVPILK